MMILKRCIFIQKPSRSDLYQLQRYNFSAAVIIRGWKSLSKPGLSFYVHIFILGSYSWGSAGIVFLQKGPVASSRLWSPGLYHHIALGAGKDI